MSVRQLRRSFAAPFVVTLASSLPIAACGPKPLPKHENPPGPHTNPPAPDQKPTTGDGSNTPPVTDPGMPDEPHKNPPAPGPETVDTKPVNYERRWTVTKMKDKDCQAFLDSSCPKPPPGQPIPPCNPPPPIKYACPDGFKDGDMIKIVLRANATQCFVDREIPKCPPNAKCNPPPPQKIACPER